MDVLQTCTFTRSVYNALNTGEGRCNRSAEADLINAGRGFDLRLGRYVGEYLSTVPWTYHCRA